MRVSLVSVALAIAVAGCGPDGVSVGITTTATTTPEIDVEFVGGEAVGPDVSGIFEVEAHTGHTVLFEVEVSG